MYEQNYGFSGTILIALEIGCVWGQKFAQVNCIFIHYLLFSLSYGAVPRLQATAVGFMFPLQRAGRC